MTINTEVDFRRKVRISGETLLAGTAYWDSTNNREQSPLQSIEDADSIVQLNSILKSLTGFFAVVTTASNKTILATDCIQSIPLYYYRSDDVVYISDSEERIRPILDTERRDSVSVAEYRTVTYVTGSYTLLEGFRQVEPGTMVILSEETTEIQQHYQYEFRDQQFITEQDLDEILEIIISRLIDYAGGRPIWVPLSAGYDSRLLLTALVEAGYEDLHAFSYGQEGNYEATKSKKVAASLDVPWEFVEYTRDSWEDWFESEDRQIVDAAMELTTVPPLREWPAVRELVKRGKMSKNSVLVPGHSADFLAGSHIPTEWIDQKQVTQDEFLDRIISDHYQYNSMSDLETAKIRERILELIDFSGGTSIEAIEAYERWDWQARQSRQITAHVWPHELTGVDWWMPYWDREFIDFWLEVAIDQRLNRRFYNDYVWSRYKQAVSDPILPEGFEDTPWGQFKYRVKRSPLGPVATRVYNQLLEDDEGKQPPEKAYEHPIGNTKMMDYDMFEKLYNGDRNARSYRARERLGEVEF